MVEYVNPPGTAPAQGLYSHVGIPSGKGRLVLCTYPLEHMAAQTMGVNPEPTWRLYAALAEVAGVTPEVRVLDPRVIVGEMVHESGRRFVWFISQSETPISFTPIVRGGTLRALGRATPLDPTSAPNGAPLLELPAFGVSVLERVREARFVPPSSLNPAVPIELEAVVMRLLNKNPVERYQDASEVLLDLDSYLRRRPAVGQCRADRAIAG